jgi:MoaA/NifB/PqqE/SkfB family radical SAM enzyme
MTEDVFKQTIDQIAELHPLHPIMLHVLGEPLLHKNVFDFIDYCAHKSLPVLLFTNGLSIKKHISQICGRNNIHSLILSVQTPSEHSYKLRGAHKTFGEYMRDIWSALDHIMRTGAYKKMRVEIHIANTRYLPFDRWNIIDSNEAALDTLEFFAKRVREAYLASARVVAEFESPDPPRNILSLTEQQYWGYEASPNVFIRFKRFGTFGALRSVLPADVQVTESREPRVCDMASSTLCVLSDGSITTCCLDADGDLIIGNVNDRGILESLRSDRRAQILADVSKFRLCRRCLAEVTQNGWHAREDWNGIPTRWMRDDAAWSVHSKEDRAGELHLTAFSFFRPRTLEIYTDDTLAVRVTVPVDFAKIRTRIGLKRGETVVRLHLVEGCDRPCDIPELKNSDGRCLGLAIQGMRLSLDGRTKNDLLVFDLADGSDKAGGSRVFATRLTDD